MPQSSERTLSHALSGDPQRTSLGLVTYCFENAKKAFGQPGIPNFSDPATFIEQAWGIGANSVQLAFGVLEAPEIRRLRSLASARRVHLESTVAVPRTDGDASRFAAELRTLRELGVTVARTVIFSGRRYEQFQSMDEYRAAERLGRESLRRAIPIARENGIRLALENHKDQPTEERLALLNEFSSETLGACLDVGNNLALLEDPVQVAEAFAPWTLTVHFKDQGLRETQNGFQLADVPLGRGCIDLRRIAGIVREKQPKAHFQLELITRDALDVPCLRENYWATLPGLKAPRLAAHLQLLKRASASQPFPVISLLSAQQRVAAERNNLEQSFAYAVKHLGFTS